MSAYLLVDESVLPEVYAKVIYVDDLLERGMASSTSEAVKMAGISRSVYYKYKDSVYPYSRKNASSMITIQVVLLDKPGVLLQLLSVFYEAKTNILTVNQNIPVKGKAFVSISARGDKDVINGEELLKKVRNLDGVIKIDSIID